MTLLSLLRSEPGSLALILGNGINRFNGDPSRSWARLLKRLVKKHFPDLQQPSTGTAPTELFDILELASNAGKGQLQRDFCEFMREWEPVAHHRRLMAWASRHDAPVLTTNFDKLLSVAAGCKLLKPKNRPFTDFYPWECRFARELVTDPCEAFGIWHINGMVSYHRSIRLGLTHYMGCAQRARTRIHGSGDSRLFSEKNQARWPGHRTWMHVIFNKPLLFIGMALEENEVFFRWLLIERARYFRAFPNRRQDAWYVYADQDEPSAEGKLFFLRSLGILPVSAGRFEEIYENPGWDD